MCVELLVFILRTKSSGTLRSEMGAEENHWNRIPRTRRRRWNIRSTSRTRGGSRRSPPLSENFSFAVKWRNKLHNTSQPNVESEVGISKPGRPNYARIMGFRKERGRNNKASTSRSSNWIKNGSYHENLCSRPWWYFGSALDLQYPTSEGEDIEL